MTLAGLSGSARGLASRLDLREPRNRGWVALLLAGLVAALLFGLLGEDVLDREPLAIDTGVAQFLHAFSSPPLDTAMVLLSYLGSAWVVIPLLAVAVTLLVAERHFSAAVFISVGYGGSAALNYVLKLLFHRPRPLLPWSAPVYDFSFPSGHSMNSFAFYVALGGVVWLVLGLRRGAGALAAGLLLAFLVGVSRVYLGYHYVSDVLGGYAAAFLWLLVWAAALRLIRRTAPPPDEAP